MLQSCISNVEFASKVSAMETPTRAEPVAQEDKTKLLKAAFLQFCRYVLNTTHISFEKYFKE